jgi:arylsulfatase A-like enzyme
MKRTVMHIAHKSCFYVLAGLLWTASLSPTHCSANQTQDQPNILWISCEDISPHLGCYGDPHAITPHLDQLASEGVRFSHAYTAAGVCAPCRSSIITGMYQNSIGTHHMRSNAKLPTWLKPFPILMRSAGYYCTNNSKTDYQFTQPEPDEIWDESNGRAHWRHAPRDRPFFAVFNFTGCHESGIADSAKYREVTQTLSAEQRQDPQHLSTLPPYIPDTPVTREDWKRNYELITAMDIWAGKLLDELKQAGKYEDTIIFFWSDHGVGLPRAKRWLYESGTHIPLIVRIPERFRSSGQAQAGSVNDDLINSVDFAPTVLNLAGVEVPEPMQGRAFLGPDLSPPRSYIYGSRDRMDERYDIIRAVRDQRFRYIRNFEPLKPYYQFMNTAEQGATMREIRKAEQTGSIPAPGQQFSLGTKPTEELYDVANDPHEVHNLAGVPAYQEQLQVMRRECLRWQKEIRDIGLVPEAEIEIREQTIDSRFDILRQADGVAMVERLVEAASRASQGVTAMPALVHDLQDPDAAIRAWGATGIGNFAAEIPAEMVSAVIEPLKAATQDTSPDVRIAAARALVGLGKTQLGLSVLQQELTSEHEWGRLSAAIVLDELDEVARPALPALQAALQDQPNKYIIRVANKAVNDLLGTTHEVP